MTGVGLPFTTLSSWGKITNNVEVIWTFGGGAIGRARDTPLSRISHLLASELQGGSARGAAGEGDGAAGGGDRLDEERGGAGADERLALHARRGGDGIVPSAGKGEDEADKPARKRAAGLLCPPVQRCGGCRNPSGARYERGEGQAGGSGCGVVRPGRVVIHGGGRRLGRRLGQAVEGGTGESLESRKQRVRGGQDAKGGKGESLESRKQKAQEWKGRVRRAARARRAAPDLERACHQVTVNASGGQSNAMDGSAALEGIEEESDR